MLIWIPLFAFIRIQVTIRPLNLMRSQIRLVILIRIRMIRIQILYLILKMWQRVYRRSTASFWAFSTSLRASLAFFSSILASTFLNFDFWCGLGSRSWFWFWCGSGSGSSFYTLIVIRIRLLKWCGFMLIWIRSATLLLITHAEIEKKTPFKRFKYGTIPYWYRTVTSPAPFLCQLDPVLTKIDGFASNNRRFEGTSFLVMFNVRRVDA